MAEKPIDTLLANFHLLRSDPRRYLELCNDFIRERPRDPIGFFDRHRAWKRLGRPDLALADLEKSHALNPCSETHDARGSLLRHMGRFEEAVTAFDQAEALDPEGWRNGPGPIFRADCHARLGDADAALADCAHIPSDLRWPGPFGLPAGGKEEITTELRRRAMAAQKRRPA